jgi:hypothetical protein
MFSLGGLVLPQASVKYVYMATDVWKPKTNMYRHNWYQIDLIPSKNVGTAVLYFLYFLLFYMYDKCVCVNMRLVMKNDRVHYKLF